MSPHHTITRLGYAGLIPFVLLTALMWRVLLACYAVDHKTYPPAGLKQWLPMRLRLTVVAMLACVLGAAAV